MSGSSEVKCPRAVAQHKIHDSLCITLGDKGLERLWSSVSVLSEWVVLIWLVVGAAYMSVNSQQVIIVLS